MHNQRSLPTARTLAAGEPRRSGKRMNKTIEIEITDQVNAVAVPFDMGNAGKYKLMATSGESDQFVLELDRAACRSFAEVFLQLALGKHTNLHLHMGCDETPQASHGLRIELKD